MVSKLSRRDVLKASGTGLAALALTAACGGDDDSGSGGGAASGNLQFTWWGSTERHKKTQAALGVFQSKHTGIKVRPQFIGWDGYWTKLATQTAAGNAPDVIQMDYGYIGEYARRNALLDLRRHSGVIDLSGFTQDTLRGGTIDGKLYGLNFGINSQSLFLNADLLREAGVEMPDHTMTWTDFADLAKRVAAKTPDGVYGCEDGGQNAAAMEVWMLQRGKPLYTTDGKLGYSEADLTEWFTFWDELRKARAAVPADVQAAALGDVQNSLVVTRKAAFEHSWSNQLAAYSALTKDTIDFHMYPQGEQGARPGQFLKPSMFLSMSSKTKNPEASATLVNALVNDPEIAAKLGAERGIPPSTKIRAMLESKASTTEKKIYDYIEFVADKVGPLSPAFPLGAGEIDDKILLNINEQISFGQIGIAEGVSKFFAAADRALR